MENSLNINDFKCPCCMDYVTEPILMCENRHIICKECCPKIQKCPICRIDYKLSLSDSEQQSTASFQTIESLDHQQIYLIRDLQLEQLIATKQWKCTNWEQGCRIEKRLAEKEAHEISCPHRHIKCPFASLCDCRRQDRNFLVLQHCCRDHRMRLNPARAFMRHITGHSNIIEDSGSFSEVLLFDGTSVVFVIVRWSIQQNDNDHSNQLADAFTQPSLICRFQFMTTKISQSDFKLQVEITHGYRKIVFYVKVNEHRLVSEAGKTIDFNYDNGSQIFDSKFIVSGKII